MSAGAASERETHRREPKGQETPSGREAAAIWDRVRRRLRAEVGEDVLRSWFARGGPEGLSAVAGAPEGSAPAYNPLYIHAGVGLGKTHLLQAIAHQARTLNPGKRARYLTVERFTVQFVGSIRDRSALDFKEQLRSIDILLID